MSGTKSKAVTDEPVADGTVVEQPKAPESFMEALSAATKDDPQQQKSVLWLVAMLLSLFLLGVYDLSFGQEENGCQMSYMYELPMYPRLQNLGFEDRFPQYGLHAYGEGDDFAFGENDFSGIPVLFLPGNSGSHKQVRSLASIALRKALEGGSNFKFDYFAVDYNEEFSALHGGSLKKQADFAALCVDAILRLYKGKSGAPKSVVLVGHSLGGVVARAVFLVKGFDAGKVSAIVTLATPHQPVVVLDAHTRDFYDEVDAYWNRTRPTKLKDITFVSVGGGGRDIQVRSGLTNSPHADVNVVSTDAPGVWVSADHQCIAWCKQLVLAVTRALFDCVDPATGQISTDSDRRRKVFDFHLASRSIAGNRYKDPSASPKTVEFSRSGSWSESVKRQFVFAPGSVAKEDTHLLVRIFDDPKHQSVTIDAVNLVNDDWLFGCKVTSVHEGIKHCESGDNLSRQETQLVPSAQPGRRKSATINLHELGKKHGYTHLLVLVSKKSPADVRVNIDVYNSRERSIAYEVPRFISFWKSHIMVSYTASNAVFYNMSLQGIESPWQAYDLKVTPVNSKCGGEADGDHFGVMRFVTPWARDTTQALIARNTTSKLSAKILTTKPDDGQYYRNPEVILHLNPSCQYRIEIQSAMPQMWGQMVRFYAPMIPSMLVGAALLALIQQLKAVDGGVPSFLSIITTRVTPISVVMPSRLLASLVSTATIARLMPVITDFQRLADQGVDFGVLPIVLFFISIGLVTVISAAAWSCVVAMGSLVGKVCRGSEEEVEEAGTLSRMFPIVLSGLLVSLSYATCGALALCLGTFCHFLQVSYLYGRNPRRDAVHFQFSLLLLWAFATLLNAPSLLAWSRNLPFSTRLQPDPSLLVTVALASSVVSTWGSGHPRKGLMFYDKLSMALQFLCVLTVLYGSVNVYRVNYFLAATFVAIALHQTFAPEKPPPVEENPAEASSEEEADESGNESDLIGAEKK